MVLPADPQCLEPTDGPFGHSALAETVFERFNATLPSCLPSSANAFDET